MNVQYGISCIWTQNRSAMQPLRNWKRFGSIGWPHFCILFIVDIRPKGMVGKKNRGNGQQGLRMLFVVFLKPRCLDMVNSAGKYNQSSNWVVKYKYHHNVEAGSWSIGPLQGLWSWNTILTWMHCSADNAHIFGYNSFLVYVRKILANKSCASSLLLRNIISEKYPYKFLGVLVIFSHPIPGPFLSERQDLLSRWGCSVGWWVSRSCF